MSTKTQSAYGVAVAIIAAGILIAGAVFWSGRGNSVASNTESRVVEEKRDTGFRLPNESDHIKGNPNAKIAIVEFSDLECPFCARIHPTLSRVVEENEDVKWIFRHFPLSSIHSRALGAAVASKCIARLGSNESFWNFVDAAFENQRRLGESWYKETAASFGIEKETFESCLKDRSVVSDIEADLDEATGTGGRGTPYVIVLTANGSLIPFSGALPYEQVAKLIEQARNN